VAYRQISTATWQDPWFEQLSPKAKLLFIYLWTNEVCNQSGLFQISQRRIEFEVGFKIDDVISELHLKVEWFHSENIVWVKNFFKWQCFNSSFVQAAVKSLGNIPKIIVEKFISHNLELLKKHSVDIEKIPCTQGVDTVPPPCTQGVAGVPSSVTSTITITNTKDSCAKKIARGEGFDAFWKAYPRKIGKKKALDAWIKANGSRPDTDTVVAKIKKLETSLQWTRDGGQYIPHPSTWLNRGGWDDEVNIEITDNCPGFDWSKQ
jgi:hypothetical protein